MADGDHDLESIRRRVDHGRAFVSDSKILIRMIDRLNDVAEVAKEIEDRGRLPSHRLGAVFHEHLVQRLGVALDRLEGAHHDAS